MFQVNPLLGTRKIKPYFLRKIKIKKLKCRLLQFLLGTNGQSNGWKKKKAQSGVYLNSIALRKAKIVCNFGLSECSRVNGLEGEFGFHSQLNDRALVQASCLIIRFFICSSDL